MYKYHPMILSILYLFSNNRTLNFFIVVTVFIVVSLIKSYIIKVYKSRKEKVEKANV